MYIFWEGDELFGYVRALKPQLRVWEYDVYKSVYCGLCKKMGKEFGLVSRFTLSYDFTFLALMNMALNDFEVCHKNEVCIAHPLKKSPCLKCDKGLEYPSYSAIILIYHKLRDDYADKGLKGKLVAICTLPFLKKGYKKAKGMYPELAKKIEEYMQKQKEVEDKNTKSLDEASENSCMMMSEIASYLSDNEEIKPTLRRFGYFIGRYVYLCDALDDLRKDCKDGNFNPLRNYFGFEKKELSQEEFNKAKEFTLDSINMTLGAMAECYVKLNQNNFKSINDNIVYLGMKNTFNMIYLEKFGKKNLKGDFKDEKSL